MQRTLITAACGLTVALCASLAQNLPAFLEIGTAHVRADKTKEFEDAVKKLAEINLKQKGDRWLALSTEYGESNTIRFSSARDNLAAVETGSEAFMKALKDGLGPMGDKVMRDISASSVSYSSEIRRRRWDLSVHPPENAADLAKMVASARWVRALRVDLKPGRNANYVAAWKPFQAELARIEPPVTVLVSESSTGTPAIFIAAYYKSFAEMDAQASAIGAALASDAYRNLGKATAETAGKTNREILKFRPDLSCPPDEILSLESAFWKPPAPAGSKLTAAREKK